MMNLMRSFQWITIQNQILFPPTTKYFSSYFIVRKQTTYFTTLTHKKLHTIYKKSIFNDVIKICRRCSTARKGKQKLLLHIKNL